MTRLSTLARRAAELTAALALIAVAAVTAACSGGGGGSTPAAPSAPSGNPPQTQTIAGVATPSSVAVVTATNAQ